MAEDGQGPGEQLEHMLLHLGSQLGASFAEAVREPRYEYRIVPWDEVDPLAADGWELRAAHVELTRFVMARKLGPADEAAAVLAHAQFGLPGQAPPFPRSDRFERPDVPGIVPEDGGAGRQG